MASAPDSRPTDEEILAHQRQVQEAELSRPPVGVVEPLGALLDEYKDNEAFQRQIRETMEAGYTRLRRCRRDGSCFYRGFALAYLESLRRKAVQDPSVWEKAKQLNDEVALLVGQFFQPMVYEDMKDEFTETFEAAKQGPEALLQCFQDPVRSDFVVSYMRFVTASEVLARPDEYFPYMPDGVPPDQFANNHIMVMGNDADQVEVAALCARFQFNLTIAYVNGQPNRVTLHEFVHHAPSTPDAAMLYRPGHYDLLYTAADAV